MARLYCLQSPGHGGWEYDDLEGKEKVSPLIKMVYLFLIHHFVKTTPIYLYINYLESHISHFVHLH